MGKGEGGELEIHEKKKSWEPRIERVTGAKGDKDGSTICSP